MVAAVSFARASISIPSWRMPAHAGAGLPADFRRVFPDAPR
jgi:hypothetical protein